MGVFYGVLGIAWSQAAFGFVAFLRNAYYTNKYLKYGPFKQIADFLLIFIISVLMAVSVYFIGIYVNLETYQTLFLQVVSGAILFLFMATIIRLQAIRETLQLLRQKESVA